MQIASFLDLQFAYSGGEGWVAHRKIFSLFFYPKFETYTFKTTAQSACYIELYGGSFSAEFSLQTSLSFSVLSKSLQSFCITSGRLGCEAVSQEHVKPVSTGSVSVLLSSEFFK